MQNLKKSIHHANVPNTFGRLMFNYLTDNKDDHCKNFSFMIVPGANDTYHWRLAPAYDLTLCTEGYNGEHATSVNGKGSPTLSDFIAVGTKIRMNENRCRQIISEVRDACKNLQRYEIK